MYPIIEIGACQFAVDSSKARVGKLSIIVNHVRTPPRSLSHPLPSLPSRSHIPHVPHSVAIYHFSWLLPISDSTLPFKPVHTWFMPISQTRWSILILSYLGLHIVILQQLNLVQDHNSDCFRWLVSFNMPTTNAAPHRLLLLHKITAAEYSLQEVRLHSTSLTQTRRSYEATVSDWCSATRWQPVS